MDNTNLIEALVALKPFLSEVENHSIAISSIDNRLSLLIDETRKLSRIIYEGNGQPAVMTRLTSIEVSIQQIKEGVLDIRGNSKDIDTTLYNHIQAANKASFELGLVIDDIQLNESSRQAAVTAKELANYGWKLNVIQAVVILLITSVTGFLGSEFYNYRTHQRTLFKNPPTIDKL
jgi:hypothetical protein